MFWGIRIGDHSCTPIRRSCACGLLGEKPRVWWKRATPEALATHGRAASDNMGRHLGPSPFAVRSTDHSPCSLSWFHPLTQKKREPRDSRYLGSPTVRDSVRTLPRARMAHGKLFSPLRESKPRQNRVAALELRGQLDYRASEVLQFFVFARDDSRLESV
jgi:hypothetical protein